MSKLEANFDRIHDISAGKHFYQFYKTPEDLLKVLQPYWQEGIRKENFCFWVVPDFMSVEEARQFLVGSIPNIDRLFSEKSFEIVPHVEWYGPGDTFDAEAVATRYMNKIVEAISRGFSVVRISGDNKVSRADLWPIVHEYERNFQSKAASLPCIVLCSYQIHDLGLQQTKDVLDCHDGVLVARV